MCHPSLPHLRAFLDRVVFDLMSNDKCRGVEIKTNPKAGLMGLTKAQTVGHTSFTANHFLVSTEGQIMLNTDHSHCYQLQGQLGLPVLHGLTLWHIQA